MTTTINLLPWREERRRQQQQDFLMLLGVAVAAGALVWWVWSQAVERQISGQSARNNYITKELAVLDQQIKEIAELEQRREELVARMGVIQNLQNNRPSIVYIFDQLVRTLPDGVYYTRIERVGKQFTISGVAESNTRISSLMRNLNDSPWFTNPNLKTVNALGENTDANAFQLTVSQQDQEPEGKDKKPEGKS